MKAARASSPFRMVVNGQEQLVGVEAEMPGVVIGEVPGIGVVTDDEELNVAQERAGVAVAGIVLVINDLFHRPPGADAQRLELDLHDRYAVEEQDDVVTMVAVVSVDAELVDDLEVVLAPVLDVDERVVQRRAVVARKAVDRAERSSRGEHVRRDDLVEQALELIVGQLDAV
jgi:hypothetical protein